MNYGIVIRVLGSLLLFTAAAMVLPLGIAVYLREIGTTSFLISIALLVSCGLAMQRFPTRSEKVQVKEALSIVALGWITIAFFSSLPFHFSGLFPSFVDSFFESVSGLTTTGATILDDIEILPKGLLFWRSFTHWLGGMGIIVLTLAILPAAGVGGYHVYKAETPGPTAGRIAPRISDTAKILYAVYLGMTGLQIVLLYLGNMSLYDAMVHTFGTVGTGGFSTRNDSIGAYNSAYINIVTSIFMLAAGVSFPLYYMSLQRRWRQAIKGSEVRLYGTVVAVAFLMISMNLYGRVYPSLFETIQHALFQVAAFTTTTGYGTTDYQAWPQFSQGILFFLMFAGGSAGSTAGSIKIMRWLVLFKILRRELAKVLHPHAFISVKVDGKPITSQVEGSIIGFFSLYMLLFIVGSLGLMLLENLDILSSLSTVAATLGNVGPGFGAIGPGNTYSFFGPISKILLSFLMLLGRLEIFTLFLLFTPSFWRD